MATALERQMSKPRIVASHSCSASVGVLPAPCCRTHIEVHPSAHAPDPHRSPIPSMSCHGASNLAFGIANLERNRVYALLLNKYHGRPIDRGTKSANKALRECRDAHDPAWLAKTK